MVLIWEQTSCIARETVLDERTGLPSQDSSTAGADQSFQKSSAEVEWSEEKADFMAAKSFIFGECIKPAISAVIQQHVMTHCPRAALLAIPILHHPLRVVSTRLRCLGFWSNMTPWQCLRATLKAETCPGAFTGIVPRFFAQLLIESYRVLRVEDKIREFLRKRRAGENSRRAWQQEQTEKLFAGMIDTVLATTLTYPFCVLEVSCPSPTFERNCQGATCACNPGGAAQGLKLLV
jgi:hypothetical protein